MMQSVVGGGEPDFRSRFFTYPILSPKVRFKKVYLQENDCCLTNLPLGAVWSGRKGVLLLVSPHPFFSLLFFFSHNLFIHHGA